MVTEVTQGNQESPVGFPDHLQEIYWVFTRIDLTAAENHQAVYIGLVIQLTPDILRKLQRLEEVKGVNRSELVEIAQMTFNNGDPGEKKD